MNWVVYHEFGVDYVITKVPPEATADLIRQKLLAAGRWPQRGHSPWERFVQPLHEAPCTVLHMLKNMPPHEIPFKVITWDKVEQEAAALPEFLKE